MLDLAYWIKIGSTCHGAGEEALGDAQLSAARHVGQRPPRHVVRGVVDRLRCTVSICKDWGRASYQAALEPWQGSRPTCSAAQTLAAGRWHPYHPSV